MHVGRMTPDQDHIMWRCTKRLAGAPKRPRDKLQERWGWPTGKDKKEDERVLEYMRPKVPRREKSKGEEGRGDEEEGGRGICRMHKEEERSPGTRGVPGRRGGS